MTDQEVENARKVAQCLTDYVNPMGHDNRLVATELTYEHRTLQQQVFELMITCIDTWANLNENQYDGRNEATVKASRKIIELCGDEWKYLKRMPLI